jgi:pyridoxamine 5'-phosphate oxidase
MKLHSQRKQYLLRSLTDKDLPESPMQLFDSWYHEAVTASRHEANAMVLSTVAGSRPSSRVVLLKEYDEKGFVFFTNYESRKGKEINENPNASVLFYWPELERQVRIEGTIARISENESAAYFDSRPIESRISAIISPQSQVVASKEALLKARNDLMRQQQTIAKPSYWGGYRLKADCIEFWQGQADRMHDRIQYALQHQQWIYRRLAP